MKKTLFIAALAIGALVSCSENEFVGETPSTNSSNDVGAISFGTGIKKTTRAEWTGADAAEKLHNNFVFLGTKTVSSRSTVFDHYNANWAQNTANSTESNSNGWEYVGYTPATTSQLPNGATQSIKYWDYTATQYDFAAYSLGKGVDEDNDNTTPNTFATASRLDFTNLGNKANQATSQDPVYTLTGTVAKLKECYISDLVTAYNYNDNTNSANTFGQVVTLSFRSLAAKIRMAFYETIPGYSVKDLQFYDLVGNGATASTTPSLLTANDAASLPTQDNEGSAGNQTIKVYFETVGWSNAPENHANSSALKTDYNKAHVEFSSSSGKSSKLTFGLLADYAGSDKWEAADNYLGRASNTATYAGGLEDGSGKYYTILPSEAGENLMIRVKYTLVSIDGSSEEIHVDNATAVIPQELASWKPNYAYTYIFKISDMTNGTTGVDKVTNNPVMGLTPITLNAVVVESEDGVQETITTVANPSITTYMAGKVVTDNDEYKVYGTTTHPIYVVVNNGSNNVTLTPNDNVHLYTAVLDGSSAQTGKSAINPISEESVDNALRYGVLSNDGTVATVTDANGWKLILTKVGSSATDKLTTETSIPASESPTGDAVNLTCASFVPTAPESPATVKYYVFQYIETAGTAGVFEAVAPKALTTGTYYTLAVTEHTATGSEAAGDYYQKDGDNYVKMAAIPTSGTTYYELTPTPVTADGSQIVVASGSTDYVATYYTKEDTYVPVATALTSGVTYYYYDPTDANKDDNGYVSYTANGSTDPVRTGGYYIKGDTYKAVEYEKLEPGTYYTSDRGAGKFTVTSDNIVYVDAKNKYYTEKTAGTDGKYMYKIIKVVE